MIQQTERQCKKCAETKPVEQFELLNKEKGYRRGICDSCRADYKREANERSKAELVQYRRQYHNRNRDKIIAKVNDWVKANPDRRRKNALAYYYRLQDQAIMAYGGYQCTWCGITEPLVLCIDHVDNNGRDHRKEIGSLGGHKLYKWLKDKDYPDGFQVLCMNCNHAKYRNGGTLPQSLQGRCNDHPARE